MTATRLSRTTKNQPKVAIQIQEGTASGFPLAVPVFPVSLEL
jgi:hypothetical protein